MQRTLISIIGNIATGKSTLSKALLQQLPRFHYLSIDQFRTQFNATTQRSELAAWQALTMQAYKYDHIIFESSGTSQHYTSVIETFKKKGGRLITIKLEAPIHECLIRVRQRLKQGYIPPPYAHHSNIPTTIARVHAKLTQIQSNISFDSNTIKISEIVNNVLKLI